MAEKKNSSPDNGEFIDLEKDQYKKKTNIVRNSFIIIFILSLVLLIIVYYQKIPWEINLSKISKDKVLNIPDSTKESEVFDKNLLNVEATINGVSESDLSSINNKIQKLNNEITNNKIQLSLSESIISELRSKIDLLESQKKINSDFFYAERYIILNDILNLKNKFNERKNLKKELESLMSRFFNNSEIKMLIILLQDVNVEILTDELDLLERINKKLKSYEQSIEEFIDSNVINNFDESTSNFESNDEIFAYLKELLNSIFKISKINGQTTSYSNMNYRTDKFVKTLKVAKEYLIFGNLHKSIQTLKESGVNSSEMEDWIQDAEILNRTNINIKTLESKLLDYIGSDFD